jgi:hypothetical protein
MSKEREYKLEEIEFKGQAYKRANRTVRNHKTMGAIFVPTWMIGNKFDILLIPKNEKDKGTETKEDN